MRIHNLLNVLTVLSIGNAYGSLILLGPAESSGTGLGAVNTVLTLQSPGNSVFESGCVALSGGSAIAGSLSTCGYADTGLKTGNSQIGAPSLAAIGTPSAANLRIMFNAAQPGNSSGVTVDNLSLYFFGAAGMSQSFSLAAPVTLSSTFLGVGKSGYAFALDATQAGVAQNFINANGGPSVRVGLGSTVGCVNNACAADVLPAIGGLDTFSVGGITGAVVPEPTSLLLMSAGLAGLILWRKVLSFVTRTGSW